MKSIKTKNIKQTVNFKATPHEVYEALIDSRKHSAFTGDKAIISRKVNGKFSAYSGGLRGKNLELVKDKKIVQAWQCIMRGWSKEYFSIATFSLKKTKSGTKLEFTHAGVPISCNASIAEGWRTYYWKPMKEMLEG